MKEMKELNQIINEIIKQSEELLEYLEETLEFEEIHQQIAFLKGEINILYREVIQGDVSLREDEC